MLTVLMIAVCLVLAGLLSSCGEEGTTGAAPLGERAENDVPLNPPTVRFHVSADGQVDASPDLEAEAGEAVAVVLENDADVGYQLRLVDPEGDDVFAVEAPPHGRGDGRAAPREDGRHVAKVYPTGHPDAAEEFTVEVFAT
ncbi:hypothetical protein NOCD_16200 [Nocardioides cavernae]|uniref:hypothetical protein n=1 Tax=Nocardioides TaxID=1839 RepID=UPI0012E35F4E|nr:MULTISPECIES: hypothetical protein [Nocardioides]MCK9825026.1 hypothetical protein [Nocardioides cavernae]